MEFQKKDGFDEEKLFVLPDYILEEITRHTLTRNLYVTDIGYFPHAQYHYRERNEGCDSHIFIYCANGEGWVEFQNGKLIRLIEQQLIVIPAGTPHRYGAANHNPWSIYWFHLKGDDVSQFIESFEFDTGSVHIPLSGFVKFVEWFNECYKMLTDKPYSIHHHVHVSQTIRYLLSSIGMSSDRQSQFKKREHDMERAIEYMNDHVSDSIKLPDLAKHIGMSKQHLIYLFKQTTGYPPMDYFLRMKIQRACQMLDLSPLTVKEIGHALGIQDPYYLSRLFKKVMGHSPTEYRNIQKG